eukprot:3115787-Rhodomonas_salina.4
MAMLLWRISTRASASRTSAPALPSLPPAPSCWIMAVSCLSPATLPSLSATASASMHLLTASETCTPLLAADASSTSPCPWLLWAAGSGAV